MANPVVTHARVTGAAANPNVLVDGPAWDEQHTVTGLENVDNTSDVDKPVSTATQAALDAKQALDGDLTAIAALSGTGIARRTGTNTWTVGTTVALSEGGTGSTAYTAIAGQKTNSNILGGTNAGAALTSSSSNILIGVDAGKLMTSGTGENTVIGNGSAGSAMTTGTQNTIVGAEAGTAITGDTGHSLFGYQAGLSLNSNGSTWNSFFGHIAGRLITTGGSNCAFGRGSLGSEVSGASYNAAFGHAALFGGTGMTGVIGIGDGAGAADPAGTANWQSTGLTYWGPKDDVSTAYLGRNTGKSSAAARTGSTAVGSLARIPLKDNVMVLGHGLTAVETAGNYWDGWNRATDISSSVGVTLTAAQMLSGLILHGGTLAAGVNDTTDTAANIVAAGPGANCEVPCSIERSIGNNTSGGFNITLVAGSGVAISGLGLGATIAPTILAKFRFVITNSTPGAEAVSIYRVG